jgi:hypothetical protein
LGKTFWALEKIKALVGEKKKKRIPQAKLRGGIDLFYVDGLKKR